MTVPRDKLHGTVINFKDIEKIIPKRSKFLDRDLAKKVRREMSGNKPLLFMPNTTWDDKPLQAAEYKKSKYVLTLFGIFEDGSQGIICINDIEPYFEIKIPDTILENQRNNFAENVFYELSMEGEKDFDKFVRALEIQRKMPEYGFKIEPSKYEIVSGKPLHLFQEHESYYIKIYFEKLSHRKDAIQYIRSLKYETAHDDLNSYYRVVSRDYLLPLANWLCISNYQTDVNKYIKGDIIQVSINDITRYDGELTKHLLRDNTMTMAFDIETYNSNDDGEIPMPYIKQHNMFMISMCFQWYHASSQLLNVCLVDVPSDPHPDFLTIICNTEENLIRGFAKLFDKMRPELIMGFNSDNYDWKWIIERTKLYDGLLTEVVELFDPIVEIDRNDDKSLYKYRKNSVKIEATLSIDGQNLQVPSFITFDVMTIFRQLYPTSEQYSLNFFLNKNKLGGKEDMPYQEMFKIYKDTRALVRKGENVSPELLSKMALVGKYCVVDSIRCHDLTNIRNVLQDKREVSNVSYTSLHDAFYRANGMKVRNLVISEGNLRNIKISNVANEKTEEGKYPGAWVFPPIKGLSVSKLNIHERIQKAKQGYKEYESWQFTTDEQIKEYIDIIEEVGPTPPKDILDSLDAPPHLKKMLEEPIGRPITGLDFSSLYPSLMMCYNLSPEYMITSLEQAKVINSKKNTDGSKKHNLYKIKFGFNDRTIRGWSVRHDNKLDPNEPGFKFGLFPYILKGLFDNRKKLKNGPKGLVYWEHILEKMSLLPKEELEKPDVRESYEDASFQYNAIDSKQRALKVFMNTFYGESGNKRSSLFMLPVAGGITTAGQENIKKAYNFVQTRGCKVSYGDTDSIYLAMPEKEFVDVDKQYYTDKLSKREYWEKMISITFDTIKPLNKDVNDMLEADNGTKFLKLAFEESLYPCTFLAKKKYYGIPHLSQPNFNLNKENKFNMFIRGLELKKRGVSEVLVDVCNDILQQTVNYDNILTTIEIVHNKISEFYDMDWTAPDKFKAFIMTGVYKPNKQNVKMHVFNARMRNERGIDLIPGDRIKYVISKKYPYKFDLRGRKTALSIGDKMELAEKAQEEHLPIDIDYYMEKTIAGQLARLITYHDDFQVPISDVNDLEEIKKSELTNLKLARKYIDTYCAKYYTNYANKGGIYKTIFKKSSNVVKNKIIEACGNNESSNMVIKLLGFSVDPDENLEEWIINKVRKTVEAKSYNKSYGEKYVSKLLLQHSLKRIDKKKSEYVTELQDTYYANKSICISKVAEATYAERQQVLEMRFRKSIGAIKNTFHTNNSIIETVAKYIKSTINIDNLFNDSIDPDASPDDSLPSNDLALYLNSDDLDNGEFELSLDDIATETIAKSSQKLLDGIAEMKYLYYNLISNYQYIYQIRSIVEYLKTLRDKSIGVVKLPSKNYTNDMIKKFIDDSVSEFCK